MAVALLATAALVYGLRFGYVTSGSMSPGLEPGDGYVTVRPLWTIVAGDVVVYRPRVLPADYIVHRVLDETEGGLVTKGDASPAADQEAGEPPVPTDRIIGVVLTWNGQPLRIPGMQQGVEAVRSLVRLAISSKWLLALLGVVAAGVAWVAAPRGRETRQFWRWGAGAVAGALGGAAALLVLTGYMASGRTEGIEYLVTDSPGAVGNHVLVGQPGTIRVRIQNPGFLPAFVAVTGLDGTQMYPKSGTIPGMGKAEAAIIVGADNKVGWKRAYMRVDAYPLILPAGVLEFLHGVHPFAAALGVAAVPIGVSLTVSHLLGWDEVPVGRVLGMPRPR